MIFFGRRNGFILYIDDIYNDHFDHELIFLATYCCWLKVATSRCLIKLVSALNSCSKAAETKVEHIQVFQFPAASVCVSVCVCVCGRLSNV